MSVKSTVARTRSGWGIGRTPSVGIDSPFAGFLRAGVEEGWVSLSFDAKVKARAAVTPSPFSQSLQVLKQARESLPMPRTASSSQS